MVWRFAFCHHEMMLLVMRANGHQSEEPKTLYLVGIAIDEEGDAVPEILCRNVPTRLGRKERRMAGSF